MSTRQDAPPRISYTLPEVAKAIGLSERQVRRMAQSGALEAVRWGGRILVPAAVFDQLIANAPSAQAS